MRIIKVNAINSTNEFARELYRGNSSFNPVCVVANSQTRGKGQRGASWVSEPGQNLTFSLLYPKINVNINHRFLLNAAVSLALLEILETLKIPKLGVKWPNDIMSSNLKLGGILIENILRNNNISATVIGVGLNINQIDFENLPRAGSLKMINGKDYELNDLLLLFLTAIEQKLESITFRRETLILEDYVKLMFRRDRVSTFRLPDGTFLTGIIRGVTTEGRLNVEIEDSVFKTFELKEIELMF